MVKKIAGEEDIRRHHERLDVLFHREDVVHHRQFEGRVLVLPHQQCGEQDLPATALHHHGVEERS